MSEVKITCADGQFLGEVNSDGKIWTTCGWSENGPAWVTEQQIPPTVGYGWRHTGRIQMFQGSSLYELARHNDH